MKKIKIAVIGGDKRQEYLADMLSEKFEVKTFEMNSTSEKISDLHKIKDFDAYILPIPVSKDGIYLNTIHSSEILLKDIKIPPKNLVLGGNVTKKVEKSFENIEIIDYLQSENIAILNAIPTVFIKNQIAKISFA